MSLQTQGPRQPQGPTWPHLLNSLLEHRNLSADETAWAMDQALSGYAGAAQLAALLAAMRGKGETVEEVEGLVRALFLHAVPLHVPGPLLDVGDGACVAPVAAVVAAGAGARVVLHGGRSAPSGCGSAEVLEELGVAVDAAPAAVSRTAGEVGAAFCPAWTFHPTLRHAAAARSALGVRTVFNLLVPLANPARPTAQVVGVADASAAPLVAGVLARRGVSALVFHGDGPAVAAPSTVWSVAGSRVRRESFDPRDLGFRPAAPAALRPGNRARAARLARAALDGAPGPVRDAALLTAAAGLAALEPADAPVTERLAAALPRAVASLDSGAAVRILTRWTGAAPRPGAAAA
jgi:anthranilate phosphoribosyltransferase